MSNKKLKIEDVKSIFISMGYQPLFDEYINNKIKLEVLNPEGYKTFIGLTDFRRGKKPFIVSFSNPHSVENIKKWIINNDKTFILKDDVYVDNKTPLKCSCLIHNKTWFTCWNYIRNGRGCPLCSNENRIMKQTFTLQTVKNKLVKINPNIKVLSTKYVNAKTKLHCKCLLDNHEWFVKWGDLSQGIGCPKCARINNDGVHNKTLAERNKKKWLNQSAIVYIIKCFNDDEMFYKVGLTMSTIQKRFLTNTKMPYNYRIIDEIYTNLYDAIYLESELHERHQEYRYEPKIFFGGYTECFSKLL